MNEAQHLRQKPRRQSVMEWGLATASGWATASPCSAHTGQEMRAGWAAWALSPPQSCVPAPLPKMSNSFYCVTGRGMFYSGTLVCPAFLSLRAGTWPLMQNRLMCSRGMARRDLLVGNRAGLNGESGGGCGSSGGCLGVRASSGAWTLRFIRGGHAGLTR